MSTINDPPKITWKLLGLAATVLLALFSCTTEPRDARSTAILPSTHTRSPIPSPVRPTPTSTSPPEPQDPWSIQPIGDRTVPDEDIQAITVDQDGNLWLGTRWDGVVRFDGTTWKAYNTAEGLAHYNVLSLAVGPAGGVWAGMEKGISRFDGQSWAPYRRSSYCHTAYCPEPRRVSAIAVAPDGALWIAGMGLQRFDGESWSDLRSLREDMPLPLEAIAITPDGDLWLGGPEGVVFINDQTQAHYTTEDGLVHNSVEALTLAQNGTLWVGTYSGVSCFDGQTWTTIDRLIGKRVRGIAEAPDGALWFATRTGIYRYRLPSMTPAGPLPVFTPIPTRTPTMTPTPSQTPTPPDTPTLTATPTPLPALFQPVTPIERILGGDPKHLHASRDGDLWLITDEGVARKTDQDWVIVLSEPSGEVVGIDAAGQVWVLNPETAVISAWDGASWRHYSEDEGWIALSSAEEVPRVDWGQSDEQDRFWLTTSQDVRVFEAGRWTVFTFEEIGFTPPPVSAMITEFEIAPTSYGEIWIGACHYGPIGPAPGGGVRRFDGQNWQGETAPIASSCAPTIEEDRFGRVWIGTSNRLWRYDPSSESWSALAPDLTSAFLTLDIVPDPSGDLWVVLTPCGGSCFNSVDIYRVSPERESWHKVLESEEWAVTLYPPRLLFDSSDTLWAFLGEVVTRIEGTVAEPMARLRVPLVAEVNGRLWFVALHEEQDVLWTIGGFR